VFSSLSRTFAVVCAALGVTAVGITGALAYEQAERSLAEQSLRTLTFARTEKGERVVDYVLGQLQSAEILADGLLAPPAPAADLRARIPADHIEGAARLAAARGYSDVLLLPCDGAPGWSLLDGDPAAVGAPLREAVAAVCAGAPPRLADFAEREGGAAAVAYAVAAVRDPRPVAALAFELPVAPINAIMTSAERWRDAGLGHSGETYLIGDDLLMRSDSRFVVEDRPRFLAAIAELPAATREAIARTGSTILRLPVDTAAGRATQRGEEGTEVILDYRGVEVLSSYAPLTLPGVRWAIVSEIDAEEAFEAAHDLRGKVVVLATALAGLLVLVGVGLAARVARPLGKLARLALRMGEGEFFHRMNVEGRGEIATLARAFDGMAGRLAAKQSALEEEVRYRRELEQAIVTIAEREKRRLGHDLHDGLAQQLAGISLLIKTLQRRSSDSAQLAAIHEHVLQAIRTSRLLAHGLYPVDLAAEDIHGALEALADELGALYGCECTYEGDEAVEIDDPEVALHLYRITQEATANAVRHGRAKRVLVSLGLAGDDRYVLAIANDGDPFPAEAVDAPRGVRRGAGMGLRTMDIRASVLGGHLEIGAGPGGGARIACVFPRARRLSGADAAPRADAPSLSS